MSERHYMTIADVRRMADFAHARTLAQRGFVAMAREVLARHGEQLPQIVVEVGVGVTKHRGPPER